MADLARAIDIASSAHLDQTDRSGAPYILHPLRIMFNMTSEDSRIVAMLHDVVEDTDWTLEQLQEVGFSNTVLKAVDLLTHTDGSDYFDYVRRLASSAIAIEVKLGDLTDNMNILRLETLKDKDLERLKRYHRAYAFLKAEQEKHNSV
ncbi:MAG: GTP pyrophosphokinase [Calditrichota bacterium]